MTRHIIMTAALLALLPSLGIAQVKQQPSGQIPSYSAGQSYIRQSYPQYQGGDHDYSLPTQYGNQYYQQEPEGAIGYHGSQRSAQNMNMGEDTYIHQYYYY